MYSVSSRSVSMFCEKARSLIIVEIVDRPDRIAELLPELDKMIVEGLITLEKVQIIAYRHNGSSLGDSSDEESASL